MSLSYSGWMDARRQIQGQTNIRALTRLTKKQHTRGKNVNKNLCCFMAGLNTVSFPPGVAIKDALLLFKALGGLEDDEVDHNLCDG